MMHDRRSRFETLEIFFNAHWERTNAAVGLKKMDSEVRQFECRKYTKQ